MAQSRRLSRSRCFAAVIAAAAILTTGFAPAHALDGPVAADDHFSAVWAPSSTAVSGNVLDNDSWDRDHTAELVAVTHLSGSTGSEDWPVTWAADGSVTIDLGPIRASESPLSTRLGSYSYTLRDSAGQTATSTLTVTQDLPQDQTVIARDDLDAEFGNVTVLNNGTVAIENGATQVIRQHLVNDTYPAMYPATARVEVVTPPNPSAGTVSADGDALVFTPAPVGDDDFASAIAIGDLTRIEHTAAQPVEFSYRLCNASVCSEPARFTFRYAVTRTTEVPRAPFTRTFWDGSSDSVTVSLREAAIGAGIPAAALADSTPHLRGGNAGLGDPIDNDLTLTRSMAENSGGAWTRQVVWRDSTGAATAALTLRAHYVPTPAAPAVTADVVWASVGQTVTFQPLLNDSGSDPVRQMIGVVDRLDHTDWNWNPHVLITDGPDLTRGSWADRRDPAFGDDRWSYAAGDVAGTDVIRYRWCSGYPSDAACSDEATVTVRVAPRATAKDDAATTPAGKPVDVEVLANDTYTDATGSGAPDPATATVSLTDIPSGVSARVNPDRTLTVTGPMSMAGKTVSLRYRLTDYTGSAAATVRVSLTSGDVPPVAKGPVARDDSATGVPGKAIRMPVLSNDRFVGTPTVSIVNGSLPAGVKATVDARGRVVVTVPQRLAGRDVTGTYRLTDANGTATARFTVTTVPDAVTGASIESPSAEASSNSGDGGSLVLPVGLAAAGLLGLAGLLARRRKVSA